MEQALYRKYRPRDFKSAIAQDHIVKTLKNAIDSGRISHAYLFTGPKGVGKTSIARILAHEINKLPYKDDSIHLDIIEIDAASNRRIDEIRDLRDRVRIAPAAAKYKVYIIDEVHMLTREAFNALLKTLEEPPAHCVFILATTEAHKLPETIISRTQRFEFKPVNPATMAVHLGKIAKEEKIDITNGALELLANFGEGSFRDSIGYLDQLSSNHEKIDEKKVRQILGLASEQETLNLIDSMDSGDLKLVIENLEKIQLQGVNAAELAAGISGILRTRIMTGNDGNGYVNLLKNLLEVKSSSRPQEYLEVTLLEYASSMNKSDDRPSSQTEPKRTVETAEKKANIESARRTSSEFSLDDWEEVVTTAKSQAASIYTALKLAHPLLEGNKLTLQFEFPLHQKKLALAKNKQLIAQIIEELYGRKLEIDCVVNKYVKRLPELDRPESDSSLHSISNIFGAAEMIET